MSVVETWCMPWQTSTTGRAKLVVVDEAHTNVAYVKGRGLHRTHALCVEEAQVRSRGRQHRDVEVSGGWESTASGTARAGGNKAVLESQRSGGMGG